MLFRAIIIIYDCTYVCGVRFINHCMHAPPSCCSVYCHSAHFQRLLGLIANQVMLKARDIVGGAVLEEPEDVSEHHMLQL